MKKRHVDEHLSAEALQAFLEGELPRGEHAQLQEHLGACARCSAELDAWRVLFEGLQELPELSPGTEFANRVMAAVEVPGALPLAARIRKRLSSLVGGGSASHPAPAHVQDFLEGILPARQAARVRSHLDGCGVCAAEAASWQTVLTRLDGLERLAPSGGFADRVMAEVRVPAPAPAAQKAPEWRRALAALGRLVPNTRKAWAALSGVAVTPVVTLGLVLWSVFTHPTLTPSALASFVWWKATALASVAWQAVASRVMESAGAFEVFSFLDSLALSPVMLVGAFLVLSVGMIAASWVLYRNLITTDAVDGHYARVSLS